MSEFEDESTYQMMMLKARECAFSDDASPKEAKHYLNDILHMESGCVSGTVAGDVCDNVDEVADIVAHLRQKLLQEDESGVSSSKVPSTGLVASLFPILVLSLFLGVFVTTIDWGVGATPFQPHEWAWAARDGYLDSMVSHYIRNGGL